MTYDEILNRFSSANVTVPGKKVKFDFGDAGKIFLDGAANKVSAEDAAADTSATVYVARTDGPASRIPLLKASVRRKANRIWTPACATRSSCRSSEKFRWHRSRSDSPASTAWRTRSNQWWSASAAVAPPARCAIAANAAAPRPRRRYGVFSRSTPFDIGGTITTAADRALLARPLFTVIVRPGPAGAVGAEKGALDGIAVILDAGTASVIITKVSRDPR